MFLCFPSPLSWRVSLVSSRFFLNFCLLFASLFFVLFLVEGWLRLTGFQQVLPYRVKDPVADMFHQPNLDIDIVLPGNSPELHPHVKTNSFGMLDKEYPLTPPGQTLRVNVVGDSFCAAVEVPQKENFHTLLEERLQREGKQVEFLNFGVRSTGLTQQIQLYNILGNRFKPDVVLLSIFLGNDLDDNAVFYRKGYPDPLVDDAYLHPTILKKLEYAGGMLGFYLSSYTKVYPFLNVRFTMLKNRLRERGAKPDFIPHAEVPVQPERKKKTPVQEQRSVSSPAVSAKPLNIYRLKPVTPEEKAFVHSFMAKYRNILKEEEKTPDAEKPAFHKELSKKEPLIMEMLLLEKFRSVLAEQGVKLMVFAFDDKEELKRMNSEAIRLKSRNYWILQEFFAKRSVPFFNLMAPLADNPEENYKRCYFRTDLHWNSAGHAFAAERLYPFLERGFSHFYPSYPRFKREAH